MKPSFISVLLLSSLVLHASVDSSVQVPPQQHLKYTYGNHKNHPVQKLEERRYFRSLAPLSEEDVRSRLNHSGYTISRIELRDVSSELIYQVYATSPTQQRLKLAVDPATGVILHSEPLP
ncbi:MAG: PepSY domain-containing protein [Campylobacterales bacterium]|nr:PepSY domain-containing protein [Campylobacterales bacterium]